MPFRSKAQRAYLYANDPEVAAEFEEATPKGTKLPEHVSNEAAKKSARKKPPAKRKKGK